MSERFETYAEVSNPLSDSSRSEFVVLSEEALGYAREDREIRS